jgi:hypothetical protein
MRYSIYADNGMTDSTMSDFVREWNQRYVSPVIRISTTEEMFKEFEHRYGASLPSYSGDVTPYWEDGAASTAFEVGLVQRASERLVQAEILSAMTDPDGLDQRASSDAWDAVNLWIEHTWGAWNSVSDPDEPGAIAQWQIKKEFAHLADWRTVDLMVDALGEPTSAPHGEIEVINTSTWTRSDIIVLSPTQSAGGNRLVDACGIAVASQRLSTGELAFLAVDIPPLGSRRYRLESGPNQASGEASARGMRLTNGLLDVTLDGSTGTIRSLRTVGGDEFVDTQNRKGLNEFIYVSGTSPSGATSDTVTSVSIGENGPLVASLLVESTSAGCNSVTREFRIYDGQDRIDIVNTINKQPIRDKESIHFRFPFAVADPVTRMDLGWGFFRPELDQLPGSCKDYFAVQRWVDVSGENKGITWTTVEAPLVELGEIADESSHNDGPKGWKTEAHSSSVLYSFVMNNYWHTNYKADQDGISTFHYSVRPHAGFDPLQAYRFGIERNQPLIVRSVDRRTPKPRVPFVLESDAVTITSIKPSRDGRGFIVRLFNPTTTESPARILWRDRKTHRTYKTDFFHEKAAELRGVLSLGKFAIVTLWLER